MASRNLRARVTPATRGVCRPGMTRAQALRQAKSSAIVNARPEPTPPCPPRRRTGLARVAPPPPEPKRLDFTKPGLTKAMLARMQHSQRLKEAEELKRRQEEAAAMRRPRRTAAPVGGDARMGREKSAAKHWQPQAVLQEAAMRNPVIRKMIRGQSGLSAPGRRRLSTGAPSKVVATEAANRSIRVIQETLDEQDVAECIAVQNKLQDLQSARRDFVMAVANVSGNAISLADEIAPPFSPSSLPGSPLAYQSGPLPSDSPPRYLQRVPELDDPCLQIQYNKHQATLAAARQFLEQKDAAHVHREAQRRIDEEFARAATHVDDDFRYDVPFEQDGMEGDISFEEDEDGTLFPVQSRIKASMPPIPQREDCYRYRSADIKELERFFDTTNYPPIIASTHHERPYIHPDLIDLEDPWYRECPPDHVPDMMEFDLIDFSP